MTRVDIRPRCPHNVPTDRWCAECAPSAERPRVVGLADLTAGITLGRDELRLTPAPGHVPAVRRAKGRVQVCCSCGWSGVRGTDAHDVEAEWGRHRVGR